MTFDLKAPANRTHCENKYTCSVNIYFDDKSLVHITVIVPWRSKQTQWAQRIVYPEQQTSTHRSALLGKLSASICAFCASVGPSTNHSTVMPALDEHKIKDRFARTRIACPSIYSYAFYLALTLDWPPDDDVRLLYEESKPRSCKPNQHVWMHFPRIPLLLYPFRILTQVLDNAAHSRTEHCTHF